MSDVAERLAAALADRYRIERELGAGGMATVYLAQDLKHNRKVALKVLRPELAATMGSERFAREIEVAARLVHPHILGLIDSGDVDGFFYYVMPYVEGETLRDRIARSGELPVHEAVRLLGEIAEALSVAHKANVVHRDIKPENILLSGRHAMVMDFGVAKAVTEASGRQQLTTAGVALGTPAYMAPEQATADPQLDGRVDIYALGVLAYEMLTGHPPFHGLNPQQTLAAHVTQAPLPVTQRRSGLSPALESVVMRCLAKRPADRFQTADELVAVLEPLATPSGGMTPTGTMPIAAIAPRKHLTRLVAAGLGLVAVAVVIGVLVSRSDAPVMVLGAATPISAESPGFKMQPAISADGEWVAYVAGTTLHGKIYVRRVSGGRPIPLTDDTVSVEQQPRFSPDGRQILFLSRDGAYVAPAQGGTAQVLVPGPGVTDALWSPGGDQIAFVLHDSLFIRDAGAGEPQLLLSKGGVPIHGCSWSAEGDLLACAVGQNNFRIPNAGYGNQSPLAIITISIGGGTTTRITDSTGFSSSPVWGPRRQLYFVSEQNHQRDMFSVSVAADGRPRGEPVRVTSGLGALALGLTPDGKHLVYTRYASRANIWSLPVNPGTVTSIADAVPVTSGDQTIEAMRVSWDGKWLIFDSNLPGTANIFRVPVGGGVQEQLTRDATQNFAGSLSPDGKAIAFHSFRTGTRDIFVLPLDGRQVQQVTSSPASESYPIWAPDGSALGYWEQRTFASVIVKRMPDGGWGAPVVRTARMRLMDWSPDGRSLLGTSDDGIVVAPVDSGPARMVYPFGSTVASVRTGARWAPDGTTILIKTGQHDTTFFYSIPAAGGTPRLLARLSDQFRTSQRQDFTVDKTRLYFTLDDRQSDLWVVDVKYR